MTRTAIPLPSRVSLRKANGYRLGVVVTSHPVMDAYAGFVPPLLGVLQVRHDLTDVQTATLLSLGPLMSGLSQPFFAWLADRMDSRALGSIGLALAAACLSSIGMAQDFSSLCVLFAIGLLGVGAYHPIAAASVGQLAGSRRSAGVTAFFVAGMVGATLGPLISTRVVNAPWGGFDLLRWLMIPGVIWAAVLHLAVRQTSHRHENHHEIRFEPRELRTRWFTTIILFLGNAMRYSVNIALLYLFVRLAEHVIALEQPDESKRIIARIASDYAGELNASLMFGMGVGGLLLGLLIRSGREKLPCVLVPLLLAVSIALLPYASRAQAYALSVIAGIGFASVIPVTISLAQRLLPHRTSLASSLTMGGAWGFAAFAPHWSQWLIERVGLDQTFLVVALLLACSGVLSVFLSGAMIRHVAQAPRAKSAVIAADTPPLL